MAKNKHIFDKKVIGLHEKTSAAGGGACLNRHVASFKEKDSCSHRWQSYMKAKECSTWYNYPAYQDLVVTVTKKKIQTTQWGNFISSMKRPNPGDWDLTATTKYTRCSVKNFVTWSKCPYWHNAHHLIPNSILNNCIYKVSEKAGSYSLYKLVRTSLLQAKYNINYKNNMVLLPMGKEVAAALGLPRHIAGIEGTADGKKYVMSHPQYASKVKKEVKKVINSFAEQIEQNKHETKVPEICKSKLEEISIDIFNKLRSWQKKAKTGAALDDMPKQ